MNKNKFLFILLVSLIVLMLSGITYAYYRWQSVGLQNTSVTFTVNNNYNCSADAGGNISSNDVRLAPTNCTDSTYAIQRTVTASASIDDPNNGANMNLWLNVDHIDSGLSNSDYFMYALTTDSGSCTTGVVSSGTFKNKTDGDTVDILSNKTYTTTGTDTYYLYIWLDTAESNDVTMNQTFSLSIGGECFIPDKETPELDITLDEASYSVDDSIIVTASLPQDATGTVTFSIDEYEYSALVQNGSASYTITDRIPSGQQTLTITYSGDAKYSSYTEDTTVAISKIVPTFTATSNGSITVNKTARINITLPSDATGTVTATVSNLEYTLTKNADVTRLVLNIAGSDLGVGNHTVTLTYSGDDKYLSDVTHATFSVTSGGGGIN